METAVIGTTMVKATQRQRWYTLACAPDCRNAGPWRVWAPEGDVFVCAACGNEMRRSLL